MRLGQGNRPLHERRREPVAELSGLPGWGKEAGGGRLTQYGGPDSCRGPSPLVGGEEGKEACAGGAAFFEEETYSPGFRLPPE